MFVATVVGSDSVSWRQFRFMFFCVKFQKRYLCFFGQNSTFFLLWQNVNNFVAMEESYLNTDKTTAYAKTGTYL